MEGNPRLLIGTAFMWMCVVGLHLMHSFVSPTTPQFVISILGALLGASVFGPICIFGIVASESFPAHISGTAHSIAALSANVGAILAGYPLSKVLQFYSFNTVFAILEVGMIASIILIFISRSKHKSKVKMA